MQVGGEGIEPVDATAAEAAKKQGSGRRDRLVELQKKAQEAWLHDAAYEVSTTAPAAIYIHRPVGSTLL